MHICLMLLLYVFIDPKEKLNTVFVYKLIWKLYSKLIMNYVLFLLAASVTALKGLETIPRFAEVYDVNYSTVSCGTLA